MGSYCIKDSTPPFCPTNSSSFGDPRCCIDRADLGLGNVDVPVNGVSSNGFDVPGNSEYLSPSGLDVSENHTEV